MSGSPHHWSPILSDPESIGSDLLSRALEHSARTQRLGLPPILSLKHLARWTGVEYPILRRIVRRKLSRADTDDYTRFFIRKRNGGKRPIAVPSPNLLRTQRWIHQHVLSRIPAHGRAFAYRAGCGISDMAKQHCGCKHLIKVDVDDFFGRINEKAVYHIFSSLGYSRLVSFELSRICTYHRALGSTCFLPDDRNYSIAAYHPNAGGVLPQGAPTSPILSNLAATALDSSMFELASSHGLVYTRCADDLVFSSRTRLAKGQASLIVSAIYTELVLSGFPPNQRKTVVAGPGARRVVLGLLVNGPSPRLTRRFREKLELHVYYVSKHGFAAQAARRGFSSGEGLQRHLDGLVAFATEIDRAYGQRLRAILDKSSP